MRELRTSSSAPPFSRATDGCESICPRRSTSATAQAGRPILTEDDRRERDRANILALEACGGKVFGRGGAAELLDVKPTTLASRIKALGIRSICRAANGRGTTTRLAAFSFLMVFYFAAFGVTDNFAIFSVFFFSMWLYHCGTKI